MLALQYYPFKTKVYLLIPIIYFSHIILHQKLQVYSMYKLDTSQDFK